ncbi:hypothetical protein A2291_07655 [candidate division WOR-1 bacterium RIFOXYB2_FULL_42_35]|nr:MAG: hypothetical protein A2247_08180 [candidate division WOR-1 bacterium RIFOXYA2_FULL_41_14]OGC21799.1 MAG: hypothetical protein A2291_07655 [candidate division WOR-1 bacterium RIFOXYB2_FULL_42_35]
MRISRKLAYSFGAVAMALSFQAFSTYIVFFYVDIVKLPAYLAATGMLIYAVWNAINDPLAGYISDHTHSRWGRRIPYIALGAIPFGLIYFLLWIPPFTEYSQIFMLFIYFVVFICLFDTFYTITILNWSCLYPEMFPGLKERSQVNAFRQTFTMFGLLLGVALPPIIYGSLGWGVLGAVFGVLIAVSLLIVLFGSREHVQYCQEKQLSFWLSFKYTFQNSSFLTFVFANFFVQFSFLMVLATVPFFTKYVLDISATKTAAIFAIAFIAAIPMLYVWEFIANRVGAKKTFMSALLVMALCLLPLFSAVNFWSTFIAAAFVGVGLSGFMLVADLIIADVIDEDEIKTGTRREGIYFGSTAFISRFAIALEAVCMGVIFIKTGYSPYIFKQTGEFLLGLRFLIAGIPIIALLLAFVIISFYPLSGKSKFKQLHNQLEKLHEKKGVN